MNRKFKLVIGLSVLIFLLCTDRITAGAADEEDDEGAETDSPGTVKQSPGKGREGSRTDDEVLKREEEAIRLDGLNAAQFKELREKAEKHAFQAEVNRMMKIIINSLYKNKEIFLRELISNASDALDKIRLLSLTDKNALDATPELVIRIKADKDAGMLHVIDTGIGMTKAELAKHLGTIAKSGTSEFLERLEKVTGDGEKPEVQLTDMIGQFGVGFYSSFLVADRVIVTSKSNDDTKQYIWESDSSSYTISEDPRGNTLKRGTQVSLVLKEEARDYLEEATLKDLVKKYSQFINFPIYMWTSKTEQVEVPSDEEEAAPEKKETDEATVEEEKEEKKPKKKTVDRTVWDWELVNDTKPIWMRKTHEVTDDEYTAFYKSISKDHDTPLAKIHFTAEGEVTFKAILFLPNAAPSDLFSQYGKKTDYIKLYVRRVFITDDFSDMMPKYLSFVRGVVDSDDLPLNVSRETLQQHKLLKVIKKKLVRKTLDMLKKLNDADFETFWKEYSTSVKLGVIEDHANRTRLAKLLRFHSSNGDTQTTLANYVARMKEKQEAIYFVGCSTLDECKKSPFAEKLLRRGYEVLYLGEPIDEYCIQSLPEFDGKRFQNVAKEGLKVDDSEAAKEAKAALEKEYEPLIKWLKEDGLKDQIEKALISDRLADSPAALVASSYGWSGNMERIMKAQAYAKAKDPSQDFYSTQKKTLELNPRHPLVKELRRRFEDVDAQDAAKDLAESLLDMATVRSGYFVKDTAVFSERFERMLRRAANIPLDEPVEQEPDLPEEPAPTASTPKEETTEDKDEL